MKLLASLLLISISLTSLAQEFCDPWSTEHQINSIVGVSANCSLLSSNSDQWFCRGLKSKNCSVVPDHDQQLLCRALVNRYCSYPEKEEDQVFCRGIVNRNCSYITNTRQQILCRGITNSYCSYVDPQDYWLCVTLKDTI